jgi:hypothetical protein
MKLTVGQYQELYSISKSNLDEIDKAIQSVGIVTGKTERQLDDMPVSEFNALSKTVITSFEKARFNNKPSTYLRSGKKLYKIDFDVSNISAGQYIEVQEWLKGDLIDNMDKILASICRPVNDYYLFKRVRKYDGSQHPYVCRDMKEVDFNEAYGCIVFFCQLLIGSIKALEVYLSKELPQTERQNLLKAIVDLPSVMDGFTVQQELQN